MRAALGIERAGGALTVQDLGRPGYLAQGLSPGGAADRLALAEGAVLLGQDPGLAALEMAGFGGRFVARGALRIALTGAPMRASLDGVALRWNASHVVAAGQRLEIGAVEAGVYGYLHLGGGIAGPQLLGSRSAHLAGGLGRRLAAGDVLEAGADDGLPAAQVLEVEPRFSGGEVRLLPGVHTGLFPVPELARFAATAFTPGPRANRQGMELLFEGPPFGLAAQLSVLSEPMLTGDVQMTGAGQPFVLLPECQTTGGYPRIGTVLPDDLPMLAQTAPGVSLRFRFLSLEEGLAQHVPLPRQMAQLRARLRPAVRHPRDVADLLGYQLISGVVSAHDA